MGDEFEYQVCGLVPEDDENEEFSWTSGYMHGSLTDAQAEVRQRQDADAIGQIWIERRSTKWERVS